MIARERRDLPRRSAEAGSASQKALRRRVSYSGYYASLPRTKYGFDSRYPLKRKQKRIHSGPLLLLMGNGSRTGRSEASSVDECDRIGSIQRCPGLRVLLARGRNSRYPKLRAGVELVTIARERRDGQK
jgi:hypothetical protein